MTVSGATALSGSVMTPYTWSFTTAGGSTGPGCPCTLFSSSAVPTTVDATGGVATVLERDGLVVRALPIPHDGINTVYPTTGNQRARYEEYRPTLKLPKPGEDLSRWTLEGFNTTSGVLSVGTDGLGDGYALHPAMKAMHDIHAAGELADDEASERGFGHAEGGAARAERHRRQEVAVHDGAAPADELAECDADHRLSVCLRDRPGVGDGPHQIGRAHV